MSKHIICINCYFKIAKQICCALGKSRHNPQKGGSPRLENPPCYGLFNGWFYKFEISKSLVPSWPLPPLGSLLCWHLSRS